MLRFLLLGAAAALAFVLVRRRRLKAHDDVAWESGYMPAEPAQPAPVSPPSAPPPSRPEAPAAGDLGAQPTEKPPDFAYEEGVVADAAAREEESRTTEETKFDRLAEDEVEARRKATERLLGDPLTERLDEPPPR